MMKNTDQKRKMFQIAGSDLKATMFLKPPERPSIYQKQAEQEKQAL